ncbi:hypothetical protein BH11VER1_BH11VER1_04510 [soil metagenome]
MSSASPVFDDNFQPGKQPGWKRWIGQTLALLIFIGILVMATAIAPVSWITFERIDGRVTARTQACVFFIIPYRTVQVDPVTRIDTRSRTGSTTLVRRSGHVDRTQKADDLGFLQIEGPTQTSEVPVTPFSLDSVQKKAEAFLADPQARELKLFVVANWKFSLIFSGLATVLFVIYLGCCLYVLGQWLLKLVGLGKTRSKSSVA